MFEGCRLDINAKTTDSNSDVGGKSRCGELQNAFWADDAPLVQSSDQLATIAKPYSKGSTVNNGAVQSLPLAPGSSAIPKDNPPQVSVQAAEPHFSQPKTFFLLTYSHIGIYFD
jgi:hypothetical protein